MVPDRNLAANTSNYLANVELRYFREVSASGAHDEWFELCEQPIVEPGQTLLLSDVKTDNATLASGEDATACRPPTMILLSDQVPVISSLSSYGVIGLCTFFFSESLDVHQIDKALLKMWWWCWRLAAFYEPPFRI